MSFSFLSPLLIAALALPALASEQQAASPTSAAAKETPCTYRSAFAGYRAFSSNTDSATRSASDNATPDQYWHTANDTVRVTASPDSPPASDPVAKPANSSIAGRDDRHIGKAE